MRALLSVILLVPVFSLGACGPTKTGIENRAAAYKRMDGINSRLVYDQARQAYEAGQFEKALKNVNEAIARYDTDPSYYILRGRIELETHRLERAKASFDSARELAPGDPKPDYFAGIVYQRWSKNQEAYEAYLDAAEKDPANPQYVLAAAESLIALGDLTSAKRLIESRKAGFENNAAMRHLLAQIARLENDPRTASRLLAEARLLRPDDNALLEELAWAQFDAGNYGDCYATLEQIRLNGDERSDLEVLGARCLAFMGRSIEARNLYLRLTRERPNDIEVWIGLGGLAWELGDHRRVALSGIRTIALAPERYEGYMLKGIHEHERGNLTEAVNLYRQATERSERHAEPHLLLGQALQETGDSDGALLAYEKAMIADPNSREADLLYRSLAQQRSRRVTAHPGE